MQNIPLILQILPIFCHLWFYFFHIFKFFLFSPVFQPFFCNVCPTFRLAEQNWSMCPHMRGKNLAAWQKRNKDCIFSYQILQRKVHLNLSRQLYLHINHDSDSEPGIFTKYFEVRFMLSPQVKVLAPQHAVSLCKSVGSPARWAANEKVLPSLHAGPTVSFYYWDLIFCV